VSSAVTALGSPGLTPGLKGFSVMGFSKSSGEVARGCWGPGLQAAMMTWLDWSSVNFINFTVERGWCRLCPDSNGSGLVVHW